MIKQEYNIVRRAFSKSTVVAAKVQHHNGREYCGYLTPSEIIGLHDAKYIRQTPSSSPDQLDLIRSKRDTGNSSPSWHYFLIAKDTVFSEAVSNRIEDKR